MHPADYSSLGHFVFQHHAETRTVQDRLMLSGMRVHETADPINDPAPDQQTFGDVQGGLFWPEEPGKRDYLHSWWVTGAPAVTVGSGAWLPINRAPAVPDERYSKKGPATPSWFQCTFPKGVTATVTSGAEEFSQEENLHPDFWGLFAANANDPASAGTPVFDLDASGAPDPDRFAKLQSHLAVVDLDTGACGIGGKALAVQLGKGGNLDGGSGHALYKDYDLKDTAIGSYVGGGPLTSGGPGCQHKLGTDADGDAIRPLHFQTEALWINPVGDAPLRFSPTEWKVTGKDAQHWKRTYLRINPEIGHFTCGRFYPTYWDFETSDHFYVPPPEKPPPPPEDPPPWIPLEDPPPFWEPDPKREETPPVPLDDNTTRERGREGTRVRLPGENRWRLEQATREWLERQEKANPGTEIGAADCGIPLVGDTGYLPAYPHATQCLVMPSAIFKAFSTRAGEVDLTGSAKITDEARDLYEKAPATSCLSAIAKGTGAWSEWTRTDNGGPTTHPQADGGVVLHPSDVSLYKLLQGETSSNVARFVVPDEACIDFAAPDEQHASVTGYRARRFLDGFIVNQIDSTGSDDLTRYLWGNSSGSWVMRGEGISLFTDSNITHVARTDAATSSQVNTLRIAAYTTGTAAAGFGGYTTHVLDNAAGTNVEAARVAFDWDTPTASSENAALVSSVIVGGALTERLRLDSGGLDLTGKALIYKDDLGLTNEPETVTCLRAGTSNTAAAGFGVQQQIEFEDASGNNDTGVRIKSIWNTATHGSEDVRHGWEIMAGGSLEERLRLDEGGVDLWEALTQTQTTSQTSSSVEVVDRSLSTSGTAAADLGMHENWRLEDSGGSLRDVARFESVWDTGASAETLLNMHIRTGSALTRIAQLKSSGLDIAGTRGVQAMWHSLDQSDNGASRPTGIPAGSLWRDSSNNVKWYDGSSDTQLN